MYATIAEIKAANKKNGYHFFDRDTLKFFGSLIDRSVYGGQYFVTSECGWGTNYKREWTVRKANENGDIETVSELGEYSSLNVARNAAKRLAKS